MDTETAGRLADEMSRRRFFGVVGGSAALAAFLAACGSSSDEGSSSTDAPDTSGGTSTGDASANSFKLFTWAEYNDPDLMKSFGDIEITIFNSNEEAIQKLVASGGSTGFDMVCPTGVYIPQMAKEGLLAELDKSKIPNFTLRRHMWTVPDMERCGKRRRICDRSF
jgi:spermidine/putrescine transport system substrate-binding protein